MAAAESYPEDLKYHREHDWARIEGDEAVLGVTWFAQDALGELVHFEAPEAGATVTAGESYGEVESVTSGSLYSEGLQYDSAGRLTVIQESVNGTPAQYTYTYDSVGRLTSATKDGAQTTSWTYDGNGNRLTENGVQSTFDAQDRLLTKGTTTYTWDALGGRKTKTEGGQTTQYRGRNEVADIAA